MLQIKQYVRVSSLDEAYELNQKKSNLIIGGMHWLKMTSRKVNTAIDLSGLGLDEITETEDTFEIGCMVSLRQLELHEGLNAYTNGAVKAAVCDIVGTQFRNTATVGGSIFGRYGFSDVLTVFMAMDTKVVCHKAGEIPIKEYAERKPDRDIVVKIKVKKVPISIVYLAQRHARTDFPILTCAVSNKAGIWQAAVGARPARAKLVTDEQGLLVGNETITTEQAEKFGRYVAEQLVFDSNMRGSADYRRQITAVLVKRASLQMVESAHERQNCNECMDEKKGNPVWN